MASLHDTTSGFFFRIAACIAVAAAFLCAGCGSVNTEIASDAPVRTHWRVLVMPLDDREGGSRATEHSIYGMTGSQGSSTVVARGVCEAFAAQPGFEIVSATAFREELERARVNMPHASRLDSDRACAIASALKADMVILGRVPLYQNVWVLFIPYAKVSLSLEAYEPSTRRKIWSAEVSGRKLLASEQRLALGLLSRAASQVHARLIQPEPAVAP